MRLAAGILLGSYEILSPLGAGGMGEVYRARDSRLEREVAIKILPAAAADEAARRRFEREARAVAALSHPNIVAIHDVDLSGELAYAVMELLSGETLRQTLEATRLSPRQAVGLAVQVARALAAAHDHGIVHRDLKPENLFLTGDGQVKVLDFGLARMDKRSPEGKGQTEVETVSRLTTPGVPFGTLGYMSPEQLRGQEVDHRSDVFSFGAVLYEMLAGRGAFVRGSRADTNIAILKEDPPELAGQVEGVNLLLDRVVRRCLEKKPADRFQSTRDLAFALELVADSHRSSDPGRARGEAVAEKADPTPSIAVLPFVNMSADAEQEYFCEGMAEEILNALTRLEGLRVAARSSAFQFKEGARDVRRVGEALNVKAVLEGSVRTAGKRLRVTAQLVNVADGYHIWSERYDRQMEDVFAIQDDITDNIVEVLRGKLVAGAPGHRERDQPASPEAYHLYLKGQHNWFRRDKDSLVKAAGFFEEAARQDPSYVLAHVGVANAYTSLGFYGARQSVVAEKAHAAIERALALDPHRPETRAALAFMHHWIDGDLAGAEAEYKRALDRRKDLVLARCWYSFLLSSLGRGPEAVACVDAALVQDPLSPYVHMASGYAWLHAGDLGAAISALEQARRRDGTFLTPLWIGALAYVRAGRTKDAVAALETAATVAGRSPFYLAALAWGYAAAGRRADASALVAELQRRAQSEFVAPGFLAWPLGALGENDGAFEWLERSWQERDSHLRVLLLTSFYDGLRADPRFDAFRRRVMGGG
jgi:TolB-like protein/Flp pilus assembly protein TadD